MKKLLILGNLLFLTLVLQAQSDYFLFIQSENNQPYYVQTDGKTLSSSAIGHLIIPGLRDSIYTLNIGFPKNQFPEQIFQVRINKKDAGYQLKNMGLEGWALFNMQTLQLIKAQQIESKKQAVSYGDIKKTDNFSTLMAGLVNDSAVLYTSIVKAEPVKESLQASIPDVPVATTETVKQESFPHKDSTETKTELVKQEERVNAKDSTLTKATVKDESPKKDSGIIKTEIGKQEGVLKNDTALIKNETAIRDELLKKDSLVFKPETAKQEEVSKSDTLVNSMAVVSPTLVEPAKEKTPDSLSTSQVTATDIKLEESKPLIVWFSETKTSAGTELVYFDMSSADKIDTIRMLILTDDASPKEINTKQEQRNTNEEKVENQKSGAGKFIGKIFGKNNNSKQTGNDKEGKHESAQNKSSIKVTTIENTPPPDSSVARNNAGKKKENLGKNEREVNTDDKNRNEDQKSGNGNFFAKLFGRKNTSASTNDTIRKSGSDESRSTIRVTTVEDPKPVEPAVARNNETKNKEDLSKKEPETIKNDRKKSEDEKTGAGKLIGKVFGKKNNQELSKNDTTRKAEPFQKTSTIKVTTVDNGNTKASTPASKTEEKGKLVVTNSDCRVFASDYDVDKLRVRMMAEKDQDGQVTEARKLFKTKCFTTNQIRALSELFRTDEGKYKLFDAAYPYVSDSGNFKELVTLIAEDYYINRFKAMVRM